MTGPVCDKSLDLLRRLEPAVRPNASQRGALGLFESLSFEAMLAGAFTGEVRSDRPVQVAQDIEPPLDASQLERLAGAADRAEAEGSKRTLMMIDGRGVVVDIASRSVIAELKPEATGDLLAVDGAMVVPSGDGAYVKAMSPGARNGLPFAGLNVLTAARINGEADKAAIPMPHVTQAHELVAPKSRRA